MTAEHDKASAKLATLIKVLNDNMNLPIQQEYRLTMAKLRKAQYDAFLLAGFTSEQAIELTAKVII